MTAGGGVVWKQGKRNAKIAVIHRPKYDDWSLPKGKLEAKDDGVRACAAREVAEETGFDVEVGEYCGKIEYVWTAPSGTPFNKVVSYWHMQYQGGRFVPNREVDEVRWVTPDKAKKLLTYPHDRELVNRALRQLERF